MPRARDLMKMDACPFSIQMKGVNVEEGKQHYSMNAELHKTKYG